MLDVRRRYANVPARTKNTIATTNVSPARRFGIFRTTYAATRSARELLATEMREYHWEASTIGPPRRTLGVRKSPFPKVSDLNQSTGTAMERVGFQQSGCGPYQTFSITLTSADSCRESTLSERSA